MWRNAEKDLQAWYSNPKARKPLVLRGARQVGKSTLVRLFCKTHKLELFEMNLEKFKFKSVENSVFEIQDLIDEIELLMRKRIHSKVILFFDEIQEQPKLLQFLRYFYEERPDIALIAAGSLLEIALRDEKFSFPVGRVEFYHLGPMTFTEYLVATKNQVLLDHLSKLRFTPSVHQLATAEFRKYLYVGGMPEAVKTYCDGKSLVSVRAVQEQILQTYVADFPKYNQRIQLDRVQRIFSASALHLGKKLIYQKVDPHSQSRDIRRVVELLLDARVLLSCIHSDGNRVPLLGESDPKVSKLYFLDVGLVNCLLRLDLETLDEEFKNDFNTKGMIAEQFIAQHLVFFDGHHLAPQLFYWLRDKGSQKGEVDFLVQQKNRIVPIEVKSTSAGHLKSLFYFLHEKKKKCAVKISLAEFSKKKIQHQIQGQKVSSELIQVPLYAVEFLKEILSGVE